MTATTLHDSLLQHLGAVTANQTRWPTDVDQAYVYVTQHLLARRRRRGAGEVNAITSAGPQRSPPHLPGTRQMWLAVKLFIDVEHLWLSIWTVTVTVRKTGSQTQINWTPASR